MSEVISSSIPKAPPLIPPPLKEITKPDEDTIESINDGHLQPSSTMSITTSIASNTTPTISSVASNTTHNTSSITSNTTPNTSSIASNTTPNTSSIASNISPCMYKFLYSSFTSNGPLLLVDNLEISELKSFLEEHGKLTPIFTTPDDLVHALKVISSIQPHQRVSTFDGIHIQCEEETSHDWFGWMKQKIYPPLCIIRKFYHDNRITNIRAIKAILIGSLIVIEEALQERVNLFAKSGFSSLPLSTLTPSSTSTPSSIPSSTSTSEKNRNHITIKLKNEQLINKMKKGIIKALDGMQNLKITYAGDAHVWALIEMLTETINDRLKLIETSLELIV